MKVLIAGDSWGCGCWDKIGNTHRGLELFLQMKGHIVTNLSVCGYSNTEIYRSLKTVDLSEFDYVFAFYTNPFRDIISDNLYSKYFDVPDYTITYKDVLKMYDELWCNSYLMFDSLNYPIHMIGGHHKLEEIESTKNLISFIPSIREMFYKDYVQPKIVYISTVFKNYLKKFDRDTIDFLYETYNVQLNLQNIQQEYFYPDGYHLNAKGHLILSSRIEEFMK